MRWVRDNRRIGAWAALFALAVQFVVSFGHVHLAKFAPSSSAASGISLLQTASRDGAPAPNNHTGAADVCAICATIALVANSVLPEAAQLPPPIALPTALRHEFSAAFSVFDPHSSFQARAPPAIG
jgi:hypothetical protein